MTQPLHTESLLNAFRALTFLTPVSRPTDAIMDVPPFGTVYVRISDALCVTEERKQYRFPKSKRKRIRKKWSKRETNFRLQGVHKMIAFEGKLYVSNRTFNSILDKYKSNRRGDDNRGLLGHSITKPGNAQQ